LNLDARRKVHENNGNHGRGVFSSGRKRALQPKKATKYANAAASFVSSVQQTYTNANITVTGHSLGAALALEVGEASGLTAIGFNGPQSGNVYSNIWPELLSGLGSNFHAPNVQNPIIDYRMYDDQVSLAGNLLANQITYTIATPLILPQIDSLQTLLENIPFLLNSHSISTIISAIESNEPQIQGLVGANWIPILNSVLPTSISIQNVGPNEYDLSFPANGSTGVLIDPQTSGGSDYVFSVSTGSPDITAVALPVLSGISSYAVRSETGNTWSGFQLVQPGAQAQFAPANGFEIVTLDQNGNPVLTTNQVFGLYFGSTNSVSATLVQSSTPPPLPPVLQIAVVSNQLKLTWSTNVVSGFELVTTTNLTPPLSWIAVTNTPIVVGSQMVVVLTMTNTSQFFRLVQSPTAPQPILQIALIGNQVKLSWSTNFATGFNLVSTTNLTPPVSWTAVTNTPSLASNQMIVTLPMLNKSQYFRLLQ
jgi:hypothetical protein